MWTEFLKFIGTEIEPKFRTSDVKGIVILLIVMDPVARGADEKEPCCPAEVGGVSMFEVIAKFLSQGKLDYVVMLVHSKSLQYLLALMKPINIGNSWLLNSQTLQISKGVFGMQKSNVEEMFRTDPDDGVIRKPPERCSLTYDERVSGLTRTTPSSVNHLNFVCNTNFAFTSIYPTQTYVTY
ncbi:hypothetical protein LIER_31765 [Lithospermum erythrorhizon]|uniref:Uncharacterized protein n=1 Tax=Lithospermum erythrorhizon TaxID=34254 RepID=A0AAV3RSY3_LITER